MLLAARILRPVDVAQRDVGEVGRQIGFGEDDVFLLGEAEQRRQLAAADVDVGGQDRRQVADRSDCRSANCAEACCVYAVIRWRFFSSRLW